MRQSEKALARLGTVEKPWEGWDLDLDLTPAGRSGEVVARLEGAVVRAGPVPTGTGRPGALVGGPGGHHRPERRGEIDACWPPSSARLPLAEGRRWLGPSVVVGELDQHRARLDASQDLLAGFSAATGVLPESARSTLAKFGLGAGHVHRRPTALSPGERTRALLAALMASGTNCLVFDEPTNHLDLPAIEALEVALERFEGTLLVVSHDRWLLESLTVNRTWVVEGGQVHEGSVSSPPGRLPASHEDLHG